MSNFTHLHVHSAYSLKDGMQAAGDIGKVAKKHGMDAVALTDHGYMGGIPEFVKGCKEAGVKPIVGIETYMAFGDAKVKEDKLFPSGKTVNNGHFLLLAKNKQGYDNLLKLTAYSYEEGFYKHPRIDLKTLEQYGEGLIATSTCASSQLATLYREGLLDQGERWCRRVMGIVGKDNFFMEVQVNNYDFQIGYNEYVVELSKSLNVPLVLTADAHYSYKDDWQTRGLVQCVGWKQVPHLTKYEIKDGNAWLYPEEEALRLAESWGLPLECVSNTMYVANMVDGDYYSKIKAPPTSFNGLEDHEASALLRKLAVEGLLSKFSVNNLSDVPKNYRERLAMELNTIEECKYSAYFLIVKDYIDMARNMDIAVGPGRGSSAGSLLAWALNITGYHTDPIKYGLYWERFLNPGRINFNINLGV